MTTSTASNVHALSIDGNFDDCQDLVKAMFNDLKFRDRLSLSGVNSINWGRIMAQITYYFSAALSLGAPDRAVSFTVPTGNFGDIFAGYAAMRMGLPIEKLVIATNDNDILARTLETGTYEKRGVTATTSPSMDIQISSNFERLLFEASERDSSVVRAMMAGFKQSGSFTIAAEPLAAIRKNFSAGRSNLAQTAEMIGSMQDVERLSHRPAHGGWLQSGSGSGGFFNTDGHSLDRTSREIPRRCARRQRNHPFPARAFVRSYGQKRALDAAARRPAKGSGTYKPSFKSGVNGSMPYGS